MIGLRVVVLEHRCPQFLGMRVVIAADAPEVAARARQRRLECHRRERQPGAVDGREIFSFRQMFEQGLRAARLNLFLAFSQVDRSDLARVIRQHADVTTAAPTIGSNAHVSFAVP